MLAGDVADMGLQHPLDQLDEALVRVPAPDHWHRACTCFTVTLPVAGSAKQPDGRAALAGLRISVPGDVAAGRLSLALCQQAPKKDEEQTAAC